MVSSEAVKTMKVMASDPKKRSILIKDMTCIGGLVLVLSNSDDSIVKLALETVSLLADSSEHRLVLRDFIGMTQQLQAIIFRNTGSELEKLAQEVYDTLTQVPLKDSLNTTGTSSRRSSMQKGLQSHKHSKTILLQLKGLMNKCDREVCMKLLLQVKGVISITFDLNKKRCILRTKPEVKPETLVQAVAKTQSIHAQQVIKNESGEELFLSFGHNQHNVDKENGPADFPDYLPDDEDEMLDDNPKAVANNKKQQQGNSWLSAAASFISSSFYW